MELSQDVMRSLILITNLSAFSGSRPGNGLLYFCAYRMCLLIGERVEEPQSIGIFVERTIGDNEFPRNDKCRLSMALFFVCFPTTTNIPTLRDSTLLLYYESHQWMGGLVSFAPLGLLPFSNFAHHIHCDLGDIITNLFVKKRLNLSITCHVLSIAYWRLQVFVLSRFW